MLYMQSVHIVCAKCPYYAVQSGARTGDDAVRVGAAEHILAAATVPAPFRDLVLLHPQGS